MPAAVPMPTASSPTQSEMRRAVDDPAQHVAADVVGAERMRPARRRQPDLRLRLQRIVGRQHVGEDRRQHDQHEERGRDGAQRLAPHRQPERLRAG